MLQWNAKGSEILRKNSQGRIEWRAKLCIQDKDGLHYLEVDRQGRVKRGHWHLQVQFSDPGHGLDQITIFLRSSRKAVLNEIFLSIKGEKRSLLYLSHPDVRLLSFNSKNPGIARFDPSQTYDSFLAMLVRCGSENPVLFFGSGGPGEDFSSFSLCKKGLRAGFSPQRPLQKETFTLVFGSGDPGEVLDSYGDFLSTFARAGSTPVTGWNSWDYYGGAVSMDDIRQEMKAIHNSPLHNHLSYIVLDMGWEQSWGEWTPNTRFPSLSAMAQEIQDAGFIPGIWVSPLQAHVYSPLGRHRQDLMARAEDNGPVYYNRHTVLDFTLMEVQELLTKTFSSLREAGFLFFKIDYIYRGYLDLINRYSDTTRGKAGFVRAGLRAIRNAIGDDAHLLGCGCPVEAALGFADSSRVTIDIHTFWSHVRSNAKQLSSQFWQNHRLWSIDPDFAVIRAKGTTKDRFLNPVYQRRPSVTEGWMAGPEATAQELQVWLTQLFLAGGNLFFSDSISRLNQQGISLLEKMLPPVGGFAKALDFFHEEIPRLWLNKTGKEEFLGLFNWDDEEKEIILPSGIDLPESGRDLWTGRIVKLNASLPMPARSSILLRAG
ncbi:MAG: alpha-galactosidase [Candidatus Ratteibacteria bacterium]